MRFISLKLFKDSDLLKSLQNIASNENSYGYVLSIVGNLSMACIKCPGDKEASNFKGELEIISLSGTLSEQKCHLHLSFSNSDCETFSGHLMEDTFILGRADILIGLMDSNDYETELSKEMYKKENIDLYVIKDCPWSLRAIRLLKSKKIDFNLIEIKDNESFKNLEKISRSSLFPQLFINDQFRGGYSEISKIVLN